MKIKAKNFISKIEKYKKIHRAYTVDVDGETIILICGTNNRIELAANEVLGIALRITTIGKDNITTEALKIMAEEASKWMGIRK